MKNIVLGFSFLTLFALIFGVIAHVAVFVGVLTDKVTSSNLYLVTPIALFFFLLNLAFVYGLKRNKKWAYILASIEMIYFFVAAAVNMWSEGLSTIGGSLIVMSLSALALLSLKSDYKNICKAGREE